MKNSRTPLGMMLALGMLMFSPSMAQAQNQDANMSSDDQGGTPAREAGQGRFRNFRQMHEERMEERRNEWKSIEPSLSGDQKQKVSAFRAHTQTVVQPLREKMQALRQQMNAGSTGTNPDDMRAKMRDLRSQMQAAYGEEHDKTMSILSDKQKAALRQAHQQGQAPVSNN